MIFSLILVWLQPFIDTWLDICLSVLTTQGRFVPSTAGRTVNSEGAREEHLSCSPKKLPPRRRNSNILITLSGVNTQKAWMQKAKPEYQMRRHAKLDLSVSQQPLGIKRAGHSLVSVPLINIHQAKASCLTLITCRGEYAHSTMNTIKVNHRGTSCQWGQCTCGNFNMQVHVSWYRTLHKVETNPWVVNRDLFLVGMHNMISFGWYRF